MMREGLKPNGQDAVRGLIGEADESPVGTTRQAIDNTANTGREEIARELIYAVCDYCGVPRPNGYQLLGPFDDTSGPWQVAMQAVQSALTTPLPILSEAGWQPIETAPKATILDAWAAGQRWPNAYWGRKDHFGEAPWGDFGWQNCGGNVPTHWRPHPAPPLASPKGEGLESLKTHLPEQEEKARG